MNIALFGGTFDPIHSGHLRAARVASRKFQLDQVLFIPSGRPPHKISGHLTDFAHRYAMVVLACANEPRFIPSLLESPTVDNRTRYSIQTARAVQRTLHAGDHLFFLIGVDALLDLRHWREYRALLGLVNFIVATRPGSDARKIFEVLPQDMTSVDNRQRQTAAQLRFPVAKPDGHANAFTRSDSIELPRTTLHILRGMHVAVASRDVRRAVASGRPITGLVPRSVEKYIAKEGLYRPGSRKQSAPGSAGLQIR